MIEHALLAHEHGLMDLGILCPPAVFKSTPLRSDCAPQCTIDIESGGRKQMGSKRIHGSFLLSALYRSQRLTALCLTDYRAIDVDTPYPTGDHAGTDSPETHNECGAIDSLLIGLPRIRCPICHFIQRGLHQRHLRCRVSDRV